MARCSNTGKHAEWRKRLDRFSRCGLTVARFCSGQRVSVASFYYWRKKLGQTTLRRRDIAGPGLFRPVAVVPAPPAGVSAYPGVAIQLPCGTRIEVNAEHLDAVRVVTGEVARIARGTDGACVDCGGRRAAKEPRGNKINNLYAKTAQKRGRRRRHRVRHSRSTPDDRDLGVDGGAAC